MSFLKKMQIMEMGLFKRLKPIFKMLQALWASELVGLWSSSRNKWEAYKTALVKQLCTYIHD